MKRKMTTFSKILPGDIFSSFGWIYVKCRQLKDGNAIDQRGAVNKFDDNEEVFYIKELMNCAKNKTVVEFSTLLCGEWFMYAGTMYMKIVAVNTYDNDIFNAMGMDGYLDFFEQDTHVYRIKVRFYALDEEDYEKT